MTESRIPKGEKIAYACEDDKCRLEKIKVIIDGEEVEVNKGDTILEACKKLGIKIPTLCYHEDLCLAGLCRICVVEVEGLRTLQASCTYSIDREIVIKTHSHKIRNARRDILSLLLASHSGECYTCIKNGNCELQNLADDYGIVGHEFKRGKKESTLDETSFSIVRDMEKCINCRRCIRSCIDLQDVGVYCVKGKGRDVRVTTFGDKNLNEVICINCGQCVNRCPTGALHERDQTEEVWRALEDKSKHVVIQTAPAPRAGIGELFGLEPGHSLTFEMNTALRHSGFDKVFDTCFTADLTILEEGVELLKRLERALVKKEEVKLPQFTSCSPGWVKFIEHYYKDLVDNLSTAKSPQQMFGTIIKTYYAKKNNLQHSHDTLYANEMDRLKLENLDEVFLNTSILPKTPK